MLTMLCRCTYVMGSGAGDLAMCPCQATVYCNRCQRTYPFNDRHQPPYDCALIDGSPDA